MKLPLDQEAQVRDLVAILFVAGEGAERPAVQRALEVTPAQLARIVQAAKEHPLLGLMIQEHQDVIRLVSHPDAAAAVRRFLQAPSALRLSGPALETLAVIAYTQPATRSQIAEARGVASDGPIATLLQYGLIVEAGRAETPGRPTLFETTPELLTLLGISSIDELPTLTPPEPQN
jgi:segregation and condensation protein B